MNTRSGSTAAVVELVRAEARMTARSRSFRMAACGDYNYGVSFGQTAAGGGGGNGVHNGGTESTKAKRRRRCGSPRRMGRDAGRGRRPSGEGRDGRKWVGFVG